MTTTADFVVNKFSFTSEGATEAVPDKLCDRVADAVLDACLDQDPEARVCCEATTKTSMVMILGEVVTKASVDYEQVMREAIKSVGYDSEDKGLDARTANIIVAIEESAPDLAQAVVGGAKAIEEAGSGDMCVALGYATDETPELMPLSQLFASKLCARMDEVRKDRSVPWLKLGGRSQVTLDYAERADGSLLVERVKAITLTAPRAPDVKADQVEKDLVENVIMKVIPAKLLQGAVMKFPEPKLQTQTDVGMSGKQTASDTYGGWGGSSCSSTICGKDGTKAARTGTYGAHWAARSLVASRLCRRASVQLSYLPGAAAPASVTVYSYGTGLKASGKTDAELSDLLCQHFDLRPVSLQKEFALKHPRFQKTSAYGHFGRTELELPWEKPKDLCRTD